MSRIKGFFKLLKYEFLRLFRNKVVVSIFLLFSIAILVVLCFFTKYPQQVKVAVYGQNINMEKFNEDFSFSTGAGSSSFIEVDSFEQGKNMLKTNKVSLFIVLDSSTEIQKLKIYYDKSSHTATTLVSILESLKTKETNKEITRVLEEEYGVKIKKEYFNYVSFVNINDFDVNEERLFGVEIGVAISIILMFGLAYSMARDNETNVSKNLNYMPLNKHKFLTTKIVPYVVLGLIETLVVFVLGHFLFNIHFATNLFVIMLISSFFILSTCCLGSLFGMFKSQIAAVFFDILAIMLPMFSFSVVLIPSVAIVLRIILFAFPLMPFLLLTNGMVFGGVIIWRYVLVLIVQIIIYYSLAYLILKRKINS